MGKILHNGEFFFPIMKPFFPANWISKTNQGLAPAVERLGDLDPN